jgi:hypothetical protein
MIVFFSCRSAPNRWSLYIQKIICRAPGACGSARSGLAAFPGINPVASLQTAKASLSKKYSVVRLWHPEALRVKADPWRQSLRLSLAAQDHSLRARKDCNAESAKGPRPIHEATRAEPQPQPRIPNNWERNGKLRAVRAISRPYTSVDKKLLPASSSLASLHGGKNLRDFSIQLRKL